MCLNQIYSHVFLSFKHFLNNSEACSCYMFCILYTNQESTKLSVYAFPCVAMPLQLNNANLFICYLDTHFCQFQFCMESQIDINKNIQGIDNLVFLFSVVLNIL